MLSPPVASRLWAGSARPSAEPLSQRELEVLGLVAGGSTNKDAAARLFISEATVKTHLLHIYAKLGVSDRAAAVAEAYNRGLLTPGHREPVALPGGAPGAQETPRRRSSGGAPATLFALLVAA